MRKTCIAGIFVIAAPFAALAQDPTFTAEEQALYDAALSEGEVIWYTSQFTTEMSETACALFTERYAGITCSPVRATGGVTFQRVMQEIQADFVQGDLFSTNDLTDLEELKRIEGLMPFMPQNLGAMSPVLAALNDPDGHYFVSNISPYGIAYNTNLITAEEAPKSWQDLLDPKWADQIALAHPGFSGSAGLWVLAIVDMYGWEYLEQLNALSPQIGRSTSDGYNLVVSGERSIAITPVALALEGARSGQPVMAVYPEDGVVLPPSGTAVLAGAKHPNAAKLFAEFMLSEEYSQWLSGLNRQPILADVPTAEGIAALSDVKSVSVPIADAISGIAEATERFRDIFGI